MLTARRSQRVLSGHPGPSQHRQRIAPTSSPTDSPAQLEPTHQSSASSEPSTGIEHALKQCARNARVPLAVPPHGGSDAGRAVGDPAVHAVHSHNMDGQYVRNAERDGKVPSARAVARQENPEKPLTRHAPVVCFSARCQTRHRRPPPRLDCQERRTALRRVGCIDLRPEHTRPGAFCAAHMSRRHDDRAAAGKTLTGVPLFPKSSCRGPTGRVWERLPLASPSNVQADVSSGLGHS